MISSRLARFEEKNARNRLVVAVLGTFAVVLFLLFFGVKILISFSVFIDKLRGNSPTSASQAIVLPPTLDPLPEATNSAQLKISGRGQSGLTVIVYLNGNETKKLTIPKEGTFSTVLIAQEGKNTISAKVLDDKGNISELSPVLKIMVTNKAPLMEVTSPQDNATISGDDNKTIVSGKVEDDVRVTINDRLVVVQNDGSFSYKFPLPEGDTILRIIATDSAGNQTKIERKVTYKK